MDSQVQVEQAQPQQRMSDEQRQYITFTDTTVDTKLLATAGSGKTFCIIQHLLYLIRNNVYTPKELVMLTFSKNARDDFVLKLKRAQATEIIKQNVCTIDAFAWRLLGASAKQIDVSILSYTFMLELEEHDTHELLTRYPTLGNIRAIFIDEAQDLNETQYRLLVALKTKFPITLHFVGDPNQNIFQFRQSSDKYLVRHEAVTFNLTCNYRSYGHIVEFCSFLRPYNVTDVTYQAPKSGKLDVLFYSYQDSISFENYLLSVIYMFKGKRIPLHRCAILAPTRGYLRDANGLTKYKGLCYISNLLFKHEIPFQQFYNDSGPGGEDEDALKLRYKPVKEHINLMTYTASKGLEWDYVIIIDANAHLITRKDYTQEKYNAEKYLLYVACSRPRKNLIIFTKSKYTNPWFKLIPEDKYKVSRICQHHFEFYDPSKLFEKSSNTDPMLQDPDQLNPKANVFSLVRQLPEETLYKLSKLFEGRVQTTAIPMFSRGCLIDQPGASITTSSWNLTFPDHRKSFMSKFMEHMMYVYMTGEPQHDSPLLLDIRNVITRTHILPCHNEFVIHWYFTNRSSMTWALYHMTKSELHPRITQFIESRFDPEVPFDAYTLVDTYYDAFISSNRPKIERVFNAYKEDPTHIEHVFFLSLATYAIQSTHYFYIQQHQVIAEQTIASTDTQHTLDVMRAFCENNTQYELSNINPVITNRNLFGKADCKFGETLVKMKFSAGMGLKDVLAMTLLEMLHQIDAPHPTCEFLILNLFSGYIHKCIVSLNEEERERMYLWVTA